MVGRAVERNGLLAQVDFCGYRIMSTVSDQALMLIRSRVLVLNQNYQPLNICDVRRAVSLLGKGKAETVQHGVEYIHTVSRMFERPEVIRLVYMVRKPLHRRKLSRREVFQRDGYSCQYCGKRSTQLTLDHVIPRCKGGQHTWENVVTACQRCNHRKAGSTPREAGMSLRVQPREPRPNPYAGFSADRVDPAGLPFMPWLAKQPLPTAAG